jgi:hypothetical protein
MESGSKPEGAKIIGEPKPMSEKEFKRTRFRVTCLNPVLAGGAIELESGMWKLCGHGTGMTLEEMNKNLIWKGKPYIRIPYCKYCYTHDTIGVFDDTPQTMGWVINPPDEDNPYFTAEKLTEESFKRVLENLKKYGI